MDAALIRTVYAAVRERWLDEEEPFEGQEIYEMLDNAGVPITEDRMQQIWDYLEDLGAIETAEEPAGNGTLVIEEVDPDWSPPHTQIPRI